MADLPIRENVNLAPCTTLKIGGRARFFVRAEDEGTVVETVRHAAAHGLALFVLGGGSNILISDAGFDGLVLQIAMRGVRESPSSDNNTLVTAAAGEDWDAFVAGCVSHGLAGVECLSGIPGLVGGTPVQNVGAYGQEVSDTIAAVRAFDRNSGEIRELTNAGCGFAYRTSIFNTIERDRYIVLAVTFRLVRGGAPRIAYKDLREHFEGRMPTLAETREAVISIRRAKSMVIDANDPNARSAGSFFKNPIVSSEKYAAMRNEGYGDVPGFPADAGRVKIPAAWLIENAGFPKGFSMGNVGISTRHTLALVNLGNASAAEMICLKDTIQNAVSAKFDIDLVPEPVFVGFES